MPQYQDIDHPLGESRTVHAVAGGTGRPLLVLVHGADRQFQNAAHWQPHFEWLSGLGSFLAVDMLGHGRSVPGSGDTLDAPVPPSAQVSAIASLLDHHAAPRLPCVAVGRSYGGRIVLDLAARRPGLFNALVLIAPSVRDADLAALPAAVSELPTLLMWADDDPVVPVIRRAAVAGAFVNVDSVEAGTIDPPPDMPWKAHTPEIEKPDLFRGRVEAFLSDLT